MARLAQNSTGCSPLQAARSSASTRCNSRSTSLPVVNLVGKRPNGTQVPNGQFPHGSPNPTSQGKMQVSGFYMCSLPSSSHSHQIMTCSANGTSFCRKRWTPPKSCRHRPGAARTAQLWSLVWTAMGTGWCSATVMQQCPLLISRRIADSATLLTARGILAAGFSFIPILKECGFTGAGEPRPVLYDPKVGRSQGPCLSALEPLIADSLPIATPTLIEVEAASACR